MRRGDVRAAILVLLDEQPYNGYGLMQEIENRSEGVWRPSPGSIYPALAQLEDEGLVRAEEADGRKEFTLTDAGRAYVDENREKLGEPWADLGREVGEDRVELRALIGQVAAAAMQVALGRHRRRRSRRPARSCRRAQGALPAARRGRGARRLKSRRGAPRRPSAVPVRVGRPPAR